MMTDPSASQSPFHLAVKSTFAWPVAKRSLVIALIVGTLLNLLNQGDFLLAGSAINWLKVALTYCVPFFVSSYGAFSAFRASASKEV